ncbi:MAG TPA: glycoside hydrolase family 13 protein [Anaerolineae bacterium]|nr:glycoside hydrolase family 13 protein [Anaerolineae bacterium]
MTASEGPVCETPGWAGDAIFYQIFPDRFARSDRVTKPSNLEPWDSPPTPHGFKGGDLLGVLEHLDYLEDLGVNALYFNPIFQSAANHRYHTHDYYQIDPILGGNAALRTLLDEAHRRGMRVMLDGVFNHASRGFFQFNHIVENGPASPYVDWFYVKQYPLRPYSAPKGQQGYVAWWDLPALPKLKVETPAVRDFLWDVATYWIDMGVDGWRLDVMTEIDDDEFWREFRRRVKAVDPEAYIVGEIWHDARRWLMGDQCDAVMNYLLSRACLGFFVGDNLLKAEVARSGYHSIATLDAEEFAATIEQILDLYPQPVTEVQFNMLGSHDTPRFKTLARGDDSAYRLSTLFQMTHPGAPSIYYGDEIGMEGGHDPGCRGAFPWDERLWDQELREYVKRCITLRKTYPALRRGDFSWLFKGQGVVAYSRRLGDELLVVVINNKLQPVTVDVPLASVQDGARLRDVLYGREPEVTVSNGTLPGIRVPARSGLILARLPVEG